MLPVESLSEAVSFLALYDLDSVLLASRQLSTIAFKCVQGIPRWQFDHVNVWLFNGSLYLLVKGDASMVVKGWENISEVLKIALHNSRFEILSFFLLPENVLPLPHVSALEMKELNLRVRGVSTADFLVDVIARFRKVQVVNLYECEDIADFTPVVGLCRRKGIKSVVDKSNGVVIMAEE